MSEAAFTYVYMEVLEALRKRLREPTSVHIIDKGEAGTHPYFVLPYRTIV